MSGQANPEPNPLRRTPRHNAGKRIVHLAGRKVRETSVRRDLAKPLPLMQLSIKSTSNIGSVEPQMICNGSKSIDHILDVLGSLETN